MNGTNGMMVWTVGPRIHGVWSLQCVLHEAGGEYNSEAQPETATAARGRRREYSVVLPSVASGSCPASWRLVLGIASCRMITALCPLEGVAHSRRSPAVLTVDQRRRTNQLLLNQNNWNIAFFYPSTLLARIPRLGKF